MRHNLRHRMRWRRRLLIASLFLTVVGARFWIVRDYGNRIPVWDEWDGEAGAILIPWLHGHLRLADFVAPHNEHRIAVTPLTAFLLFRLNGEWDPRVALLFNAVVWAAVAAWFGGALLSLSPRRARPIVV